MIQWALHLRNGSQLKEWDREDLWPMDTLSVRLPRRVTGVTVWVSRQGDSSGDTRAPECPRNAGVFEFCPCEPMGCSCCCCYCCRLPIFGRLRRVKSPKALRHFGIRARIGVCRLTIRAIRSSFVAWALCAADAHINRLTTSIGPVRAGTLPRDAA
jgi:hypothetical protein